MSSRTWLDVYLYNKYRDETQHNTPKEKNIVEMATCEIKETYTANIATLVFQAHIHNWCSLAAVKCLLFSLFSFSVYNLALSKTFVVCMVFFCLCPAFSIPWRCHSIFLFCILCYCGGWLCTFICMYSTSLHTVYNSAYIQKLNQQHCNRINRLLLFLSNFRFYGKRANICDSYFHLCFASSVIHSIR